MTLSQLFHEYDENLKIVNELRWRCRLDPNLERVQELGAFLLWRSSLRLQILQIYFSQL